jgi:DNA-binding NarL/FixJ family response regulator
MTQLRVLIIHPQALVRAGLRQLLSEEHRHVIFAEAINAEEAVTQIARQPWDIAIVDIGTPARNRLHILQETLRRRPGTHVLAIHADGDTRYPVLALQMGALGCIHKSVSRNNLLKAFKSVAAGKVFLGRSLDHPDYAQSRTANKHAQLSVREHTVLLALAAGKRTGEIATEWGLSPKSVSTYKRRILDKMGLNSTADLIRYAIGRPSIDESAKQGKRHRSAPAK